ncbi:hypothetical protein MIR68_001481 [Amoeboaphelidium protococcarum]|nr:hypothetical protein MIR68_001481 [Amoeboaphelidium protococcarum]
MKHVNLREYSRLQKLYIAQIRSQTRDIKVSDICVDVQELLDTLNNYDIQAMLPGLLILHYKLIAVFLSRSTNQDINDDYMSQLRYAWDNDHHKQDVYFRLVQILVGRDMKQNFGCDQQEFDSLVSLFQQLEAFEFKELWIELFIKLDLSVVGSSQIQSLLVILIEQVQCESSAVTRQLYVKCLGHVLNYLDLHGLMLLQDCINSMPIGHKSRLQFKALTVKRAQILNVEVKLEDFQQVLTEVAISLQSDVKAINAASDYLLEVINVIHQQQAQLMSKDKNIQEYWNELHDRLLELVCNIVDDDHLQRVSSNVLNRLVDAHSGFWMVMVGDFASSSSSLEIDKALLIVLVCSHLALNDFYRLAACDVLSEDNIQCLAEKCVVLLRHDFFFVRQAALKVIITCASVIQCAIIEKQCQAAIILSIKLNGRVSESKIQKFIRLLQEHFTPSNRAMGQRGKVLALGGNTISLNIDLICEILEVLSPFMLPGALQSQTLLALKLLLLLNSISRQNLMEALSSRKSSIRYIQEFADRELWALPQETRSTAAQLYGEFISAESLTVNELVRQLSESLRPNKVESYMVKMSLLQIQQPERVQKCIIDCFVDTVKRYDSNDYKNSILQKPLFGIVMVMEKFCDKRDLSAVKYEIWIYLQFAQQCLIEVESSSALEHKSNLLSSNKLSLLKDDQERVAWRCVEQALKLIVSLCSFEISSLSVRIAEVSKVQQQLMKVSTVFSHWGVAQVSAQLLSQLTTSCLSQQMYAHLPQEWTEQIIYGVLSGQYQFLKIDGRFSGIPGQIKAILHAFNGDERRMILISIVRRLSAELKCGEYASDAAFVLRYIYEDNSLSEMVQYFVPEITCSIIKMKILDLSAMARNTMQSLFSLLCKELVNRYTTLKNLKAHLSQLYTLLLESLETNNQYLCMLMIKGLLDNDVQRRFGYRYEELESALIRKLGSFMWHVRSAAVDCLTMMNVGAGRVKSVLLSSDGQQSSNLWHGLLCLNRSTYRANPHQKYNSLMNNFSEGPQDQSGIFRNPALLGDEVSYDFDDGNKVALQDLSMVEYLRMTSCKRQVILSALLYNPEVQKDKLNDLLLTDLTLSSGNEDLSLTMVQLACKCYHSMFLNQCVSPLLVMLSALLSADVRLQNAAIESLQVKTGIPEQVDLLISDIFCQLRQCQLNEDGLTIVQKYIAKILGDGLVCIDAIKIQDMLTNPDSYNQPIEVNWHLILSEIDRLINERPLKLEVPLVDICRQMLSVIEDYTAQNEQILSYAHVYIMRGRLQSLCQ